MADNKLSWTELRRALTLRAGVKETDANAFLNAFQTQLIEALKSDKQVKINGLGTFKLQAVAPRKSVNVTTGEEITIEGYNKIAFTPEAGVKELVEKSTGELGVTAEALGLNDPIPTEPVDPLKKLGAQAEEIVEILGELGQSPNSPKPGVKPAEQPVVVEEKPVVVEEKKEEPVVEEKPIATEEPKPKYHFVRDTLICVVILLMLLLIGYFFLRSQLSSWIEEFVNKQPQTEEVIIVETPAPSAKTTPVEIVTPSAQEPTKWEYEGWITTEEITAGSRLAWIAKKHYGNKVYWPYLYDANRDKITNPGKIAIGTPIRVPKLSAAQRDTTDVRFLNIKKEAEEACKK